MPKLILQSKVQDERTNQTFGSFFSSLNSFQDAEIFDTGSANTDFVVSHRLNRAVNHVIVLKQDRAGSIYFSPYEHTETKFVVLRASAANMRVILRLE